jgi:hypothetical protein
MGFLLLLYCTIAEAQVNGDQTLPLKFSSHTYSVTMGNILNSVIWNIYDSTATRERIDEGIDHFYNKTTDYKVIDVGKDLTSAFITIEFSGNLTVWKKYKLAYREESADKCYIYKFFEFTIQPPIDIDIVQVSNRCPDSDLQYLEGTGSPVLHTTIEYHVVLRNTDYQPDGDWSFNFQIIATGQSGASATIDTVRYGSPSFGDPLYSGVTWSQPPLSSSNVGSAAIHTTIHDVQFLVTFNDVPGVRQRIDFRLDQIEGAFGERDLDVLPPPKMGENEIVHYLEAIPVASYIAAVD